MTDAPTPPAGPRSRRSRLPALTFVIGLALGMAIVALLQRGVADSPTAAPPTQAPGTATGSRPSAVQSANPSAGAQVNAACLRVIDDAREVHDILTGVDTATADVDLQRLDDIVRRLQPIEPRLGRDLEDCSVDASLGSPVSTGSPPSPDGPTPSPTG